jgi:hypothetical protein
LATHYKIDSSTDRTYWIKYIAGTKKPHETFATLFTPSTNFLNRAWFYCDATLSSVMIESLWFGLHRRNGDDVEFDTVCGKPDYVYLGPHVYAPSHQTLMNDDPADVYFENGMGDLPTLQLGDELVVWNHRLYDEIAAGDWRNEYSIVMDIDTDPEHGTLDSGLFLSGHGITTRKAADVAAELASILGNRIDVARDAVRAAIAIDPNAQKVDFMGKPRLVRWDPYGELSTPWWVEIPRTVWLGWYPTKEQALAAYKRAVISDPSPGTGYAAPPDPEALYFPLWEPAIFDGGFGKDPWDVYFESRRTGMRGALKMVEVKVDGRITPGLFYRAPSTFPTIKPQAG